MIANQSSVLTKGIPPWKSIKVLIVEPDLAVAEVITFMLEVEGATVQTTQTLKTAITAFAQFQPNLLICNLQLPDGEGYSLVSQCQLLGHSTDFPIPAIAIADAPWKVDRQKAISSGFHQYLFEPTEYSALMGAIASVWERKNGHPQSQSF